MPKDSKRTLKNWAHLRFSIVGPLLATPPGKGELAKELEKLASRRYPHPTREGEWVTFAFSTLERWYYQALETDDPVASLSRKVRADAGQCKAVDSNLLQILKNQYGNFPQWSRQLHSDNLVAYLKEHPEMGTAPSYSSVRRVMAKMGWRKKPKPGTDGQRRAAERLQSKEVRSFEAPFVHSLWHLDFHECSRKVADAKGIWHKPKALCILDDRSRLCCHIQWYLGETAEGLIHGLIQAFQKRRLPRSLLTDNGSAMTAGETENGLLRLGIIHDKTLPYSPYANGKQECFWGQLEGRLIAMLSNIEHLTLEMLNNYSQAWVEMEYNRSIHSEIAMSPLDRLLNEKTVCRPCPNMQTLRFAFTVEVSRTQRRSDGTLSIDGVRFEVPCRMRHFDRLTVRYRSWDLSMAYLVDPREGQILAKIHPQDKAKNAHGFRRLINSADTITPPKPDKRESIPPLLRRLLADYAATGLPAAYIPKDEKETSDDH